MSEVQAIAVPDGWKPVRMHPGFFMRTGSYNYQHQGPGVTHWAFRADDGHLNANGTVHGGMLMTFADHVAGAAVFRAVNKRPCATVTLNTDFLAAAKSGDWVEGVAEVTRTTRSLAFVRVKIWSEDRTILTATGIWKIFGERAPKEAVSA